MYLTIFLIITLTIYWVILIIKYEYDKTLPVVYNDDIMDEINPIVAGLIVNNRNIYITDIIAVILNLVKKGILTFKSMKKGENYLNILTLNKKAKLDNLDEIEKCIYELVFEDKKQIDLNAEIVRIANDKKIKLNFKKVDRLVKVKLEKIGANTIVVPSILKFTNNIIAIITMIYIAMNICFDSRIIQEYIFNNLNFSVDSLSSSIEVIVGIIILFMGTLLYFISIVMRGTFNVRNKIYSFLSNFSDKKIVLITITNIMLSGILFLVIGIFLKSNVILEFALFLIIVNIISTDQIMAKHKKSVMKLYCQLNTLKDKIKNYSLLKEKNIEHYNLWENYLIFAIVFNLNKEIVLDITKHIKKTEYTNIMINVYNNDDFKTVNALEYMAKEYNKNIFEYIFKM